MKYEYHNDRAYVTWWTDHFPYHVFVKVPEESKGNWWIAEALKASSWLTAQFPDCEGDTSIGRNTSTFRPYHEYDWGFSYEVDGLLIFYFKEAKHAFHFKLVWG